MTQQTQDPKPSQAMQHGRKVEPVWVWLALVAGSVVIHLLLVMATVPWLRQLSSPESKPVTFVPIDLIDLPPETSETSGEGRGESSLAAIVPSANHTPSSQSAPGKAVAASPTAAPIPKRTQSVAPVPSVSSSSDASLPPSSSPVQSPVQDANPVSQTEPSQSSTAETVADDTETAVAPSAAQPSQSPESTEVAPTPRSASPSTTAATPGFATIPIDIPTPDVSQTLAASPSPSPSPLAQVEVNRENAPVRLTVHLDFERIAAEKAGDNPDRLAAPTGGLESREISSVDESACAGALKPEIMQSLGLKISLQVSTDARGQVTQIGAQSVSPNPDYNELARCLVQHWGFVPAEEAGEPVPSSALLVWVTIDQT